MKKILINASTEGEVRVAIIENQQLFNLSVESTAFEQKRANIYNGIITRIEPSLEAAFVDYGEARQGFLPFKDIAINAISEDLDGNANIVDHIRQGMQLIVQVEKEERGNKGASLTTYISLAGQYLILLPFAANNRSNGISRTLSYEQRQEARKLLTSLEVPDNLRVILRTSGVGRHLKELQWNLDYLVRIWELISQAAQQSSKPTLLYKEGDAVMKAIRDNLRDDVEIMLIDNEQVYNNAHEFLSQVMPNQISKLQQFTEHDSLFGHYQIEKQIESVYSRQVSLPSGGEIVIDLTEALVSIDVNSGKATRGKGIEETALLTNLEAAEEVMRQLRLRDLGGLVVIDFIDMLSSNNRKQIEQKVSECCQEDRARINVGRISRFGLLELSRQHLGTSLTNLKRIKCHCCGSTHLVRTINSICLSLVNLLEEEAITKGISTIQLELPLDTATYLLNEHRNQLNRIESRHGIGITVIPNHQMTHPNYKLRSLGINHKDSKLSSHQLRTDIKQQPSLLEHKKSTKNRALIDLVLPEKSAPKLGFWQRWLQRQKTPTAAVKPAAKPTRQRQGARFNSRTNQRRPKK